MLDFGLKATKRVVGFEKYLVTEDGVVFREGASKPLSQSLLNSGYLSVEFWKNNTRKRVAVHVVVGEAWIRARNKHECIRHLDGNKMNNHASNLSLGTKSDNERDKALHGASNRGCRHGMSKLTEGQVLEIHRRSLDGENTKSLASEFLICERYVREIKREDTWKHVLVDSNS